MSLSTQKTVLYFSNTDTHQLGSVISHGFNIIGQNNVKHCVNLTSEKTSILKDQRLKQSSFDGTYI